MTEKYKIGIIGLGYVGFPLAFHFEKLFKILITHRRSFCLQKNTMLSATTLKKAVSMKSTKA